MNNKTPLCACGCGKPVKKIKKEWNKYVWGHNRPIPFAQNKLIYQDNILTKFLIESPKHGNFEILIDTEDWDKVKQYRWKLNYNKKWSYVTTHFKNNKKLRLHRMIIKASNNKIVDHINHNTLDNRKLNLRKCTYSENLMNQIPKNKGSSIYKGVFFSKKDKSFISTISVNGNVYKLGYFKHEINAAKEYNKAAIKYHGEFAYLNEIPSNTIFPKEPPKKIKTSKYIGVSKENNRYRVQFKFKNKKIHYGCYKNEIDAAKAYNNIIIKYRGDKAILNQIPYKEANV